MLELIGNTALWAAMATGIALLSGLPLAFLLARKSFFGRGLVSGLVSLPMVLPPTAVGFLLLALLSERGFLGGASIQILFSWPAVVLACTIMSFPLVVRTLRLGLEKIPSDLIFMSRSLGHTRAEAFWKVEWPLLRPHVAIAVLLGFTRAVGEFGATMVVAGNIEEKTETLSTAIYRAYQLGDDRQAYLLIGISLALGVGATVGAEFLARTEK